VQKSHCEAILNGFLHRNCEGTEQLPVWKGTGMKMKKYTGVCTALLMSVLLAMPGAGAMTVCAAEADSEAQEEIVETETETVAALIEAGADVQSETENETSSDIVLADGIYSAEFDTDSSMFHVNEANEGRGTLTVEDGKMTIHVSLTSKHILNLYAGLAEDAAKEGAELIEPTTDTVTYSDGMTEEVYGFDIPVPALDEEFDVALIGTKGTWYDHKVSVTDPQLLEETSSGNENEEERADGTYTIEVTLSGGSGKATVESPTLLVISEGKAFARITWSSPHYDYMIVDGERYEPVNTEGNSVFEIPVAAFDTELPITADTTAMSTPHEIEYTLYFDSATITAADSALTESDETSVWCGLAWDHSLELTYATQFSVDYYEGGYTRITIGEDDTYLLVPEGQMAPEGLDEDVTVLQKPLQNLYLVATSAMDFFSSLDAMDAIRLSGTAADGWYVEKAKQAMEDGSILYAGKYSAPDYELILSQGCDLAVESTMIYHNPEVKEKLEEFGIPVLVERSSYESHPMGRTEWIKLYGVLLGKEEQAQAIFEDQVRQVEEVEAQEDTGKTVAFFYISSNGYANVRKSTDYVARMIALAGGSYIFDSLGDDTALSTVNMTMEEFYAQAKDADYIIYNSTIDGEINTMEELLAKSALLADFRAVQEGNVWCTGKNLFQETTSLGDMIVDIHTILSEEDVDEESLHYLHRII
jgi:iron complex transport system substrate-binding protein